MPPAPEVLLAVFAAWTAGTAAFAALTRIGGLVGAGHFKVAWLVTAGLAAVAAIWSPAAWTVAAAGVAAFVSLYLRVDRVVGWVATAAGAALVAVVAGSAPAAAYAAAAAVLLGAVTNAMLLGHWHLNQPGLRTGPLSRLVAGLWAGEVAHLVAAGAVVAAAARAGSGPAMTAAVTAVAFTGFSAVLAGMVTHLVRTRSIMSATGILYLAVLLCFVAVFTGTLALLSIS